MCRCMPHQRVKAHRRSKGLPAPQQAGCLCRHVHRRSLMAWPCQVKGGPFKWASGESGEILIGVLRGEDVAGR